MTASIQHPLGRDSTIPKMIDEDRLLALTRRIRSGEITKVEREELGRGFIRIALKIAGDYASRKPSKADEFASAALFGIAYALDRAQEKLYDDNITAWVISCIRRFLRHFYETDHMVRVPYHTHRKLKGPEVYVVDEKELSSGEGARSSVLYHRVRINRSGGMTELREIIQMSARDDRDLEIIKMRSEGYCDKEIAEALDLSVGYINLRRNQIETRFNKLNR